MENNNSGSSFLDSAKDFAVSAYDKTKEELSRVQKNSVERQHVVDRETKANLLTSRQQEQLKKISNADDAQRFVEAAQLGGPSGGQKEYEEIIDNQRKALISFGTDVAGLAVGGAAVKGGLKLGGSIFKGGAEAIGSKLPTLKKYSNMFKSETELADEAKAAATAQKEAEAQKKAQEYVQQQRQQAGKQSTPFKSNTEKLVEKAKEEVKDETTPNKKGYIRKTLEWMGNKTADAGKFVGSQVLAEGKTLGKSALKGGIYGAAASGIGAGVYSTLSEEDQLAVKNKAQELVDAGTEKFPGLVDEAGNLLKNATESTTEEGVWDKIKNKGKELLGEYGEKIPAAALGAYVAGGSSPFRAAAGGMGALFASGNSAEATLSSMPSGGDSGTTGESHFGSSDMSGKTVIEVLNKIYGILSKVYDTVENIANDTASMVRGQSQQDASRDLSSSNLRARQNEGGGFASPIFGGGGGESSADLNKEDETEAGSGIWSKVLKKIPLGKILKGAAVGGAAVAGLAYSGAAGAHTNEENQSAKKLKPGEKGVPVSISDASDEYLKTVGLIESHGIADVKAQGSSATGLYQFTAGTWKDTVKKMGKNYSLEDRKDPKKAEEVMRFFTNQNKKIFAKQTGREPTNQESYMSHFLGAGGAAKFANAGQNATAANVLPNAAKANYNIFYDKKTGRERSVGEVTSIMGKRYDDGKQGLETGKYQGREIPETIRNVGSGKGNTEKPHETVIEIDGNKEQNKATPLSKVSYNPDSEKLNATNTAGTDNGKSQVDLLNDAVDKMNSTKYEFFDEDADKIRERQDKFYAERAETNEEKVSTNKASPVTNSKMDDMQAEVGDIDAQKASLTSERENMGMAVNVSGEQFNKDEDRIKDISTEMGALNERRNNITGSKEYLEGIENMKQGGGNKQAAPQQAASQQAAPPPRNNPGSSKSVPSVRNDDPTIKMMEEGNMWRTNTHEA